MTDDPDPRILRFGDIHIYFHVFTPDEAERWLEANTANRSVSIPSVQMLARAMRENRFLFIGDAIRRGADGEMQDGQHRLLAIRESGITQTLLVIDGLPPAAKALIDTGRHRTSADYLRMLGHKNYTILASAARVLMRAEQGLWLEGGGANYNNDEIALYVAGDPQLEASVQVGAEVRGALLVAPTPATVAHRLMVAADTDHCAQFFSRLINGTTTAGTGEHALRERLIKSKVSREGLSGAEVLSLFIQGWNASIEGRPVSRLQLPKGGLSNANFPQVKTRRGNG